MTEMLPELAALKQIRLEEDLTFGQLAERIGIEGSSLHRLLHEETAPMERTLYKIRRYLDSRKTPVVAKRRRTA